MSLAEQAQGVRLAWEAGDRDAGIDEAIALCYTIRVHLGHYARCAEDGDTGAEDRLERITPALCALAERIAAVGG